MNAITTRFHSIAIIWLATSLLASALGLSLPTLAAGVKVVYPTNDIPNDQRHYDILALLRMALEKTEAKYGPFELSSSPTPMPKARYLLALEQRHEINIAWTSSSEQNEHRFLPIRIPLRKTPLKTRTCTITPW